MPSFSALFSRGIGTIAIGFAAGLLLATTGCSGWAYDQVRLAHDKSDYETKFLTTKTRRTELGLANLDSDGPGRTDAVVVLVTHDRRIAGKFHATLVERNYGFTTGRGYQLRGEFDTHLAGFSDTGAVDALRAISVELLRVGNDKLVRDVHSLVAAGLIRMIEQAPQGAETLPVYPRLLDMLERVPAGGVATINDSEPGIIRVHYQIGVAP